MSDITSHHLEVLVSLFNRPISGLRLKDRDQYDHGTELVSFGLVEKEPEDYGTELYFLTDTGSSYVNELLERARSIIF